MRSRVESLRAKKQIYINGYSFYLFFLLLLTITSPSHATGLTLHDAVTSAVANNPNLAKVTRFLVKSGYKEAYNVTGGIVPWIKAGLPVERYEQTQR